MPQATSHRYWLVKSEANCYSIDDLKRDKKTAWEGVRNYTARNFMRDSMKKGDLVLFYHSVEETGIYGLAKVASAPHADESAFNKKDEHYDPKSKREAPTWICVDLAFVKKFNMPLSLAEIKINPAFSGMQLTMRGDRLSVQPVSEKHFMLALKKLEAR